MTNKNRQAGGTLLGLILGLIIGLAIAVGVAMYLTKSSLPFTNKFAAPEKPMPATGDLPDPNTPMYGQKPALPASGTAPSSSVPAPPSAPANTINGGTPSGQANAVNPGDNGNYTYYLQAGAFRSMAEAESLRAKLALLGFEAKISDSRSDNGALHRVRLGPFHRMAEVNKVRGKLSDNGVDVAVVRIGK